MARPRKLGPTITFRLPIELHTVADERARRLGLTVNEYVAARFTDALSRAAGDQAVVPSPPAVPQPERATPRHAPIWKEKMKP